MFNSRIYLTLLTMLLLPQWQLIRVSSAGLPQVATPTFSPAGGTYTSSQSVTISTATSGATICYTTDGSTPTESGNSCSGGTTQTYSTAITVSSSETVNAIGTKAGFGDSIIGSAVYTISALMSPTVVINKSTGTDNVNLWSGTETAPTLTVNLPGPDQFQGGNNCAVMAVSTSNSLTQSTPTDNKSETWTAGPSIASGNFTWKLWYVLGDTAGTNQIQVATTGSLTSGKSSQLGAIVSELKNCNTSSVGGSGSMSTSATGSALMLTLSAAPSSGDMVWAAFIDTSTPINSQDSLPFDSSITEGTGFTAISKSLSFGKMAEESTSSTSTSVTATYPSTGSHNIEGVAIVIKQGQAGNSPSGLYIDHYQVEQANGSNTFDFPCAGNLIVGLVSTTGPTVSSVSASTGTWQFPSSASVSTSGTGASQIFYGYGASCGSGTNLTPTFSASFGGTVPGQEVDLASVTNALGTSSVFDQGHTSTGNQTGSGNLTTDTISQTSGDIVFNMTSITLDTINGTVTDSNSHTPLLTSDQNNKLDNRGSGTPPSTLSEDNGWSALVTADSNPVTFIYNGGSITLSVGDWWSASAAFK